MYEVLKSMHGLRISEESIRTDPEKLEVKEIEPNPLKNDNSALPQINENEKLNKL